MRELLAVALGGMLGSVSRYTVNLATEKFISSQLFPIATLLVNVLGCFLIGILSIAARRELLSTPWELALRVGFLGAFTTFSAFGLEVVRLWQADRPITALFVIATNVVLGLAAVLLGEQAWKWFAS